MIVYVARHGETTWNREGRYQGQRESDLSELGWRQENALADALGQRPVQAIVTSPLRRCRETASGLAEALDVEPIVDDRLMEIAHGTWEGRLRDDVAREDAARYAAWRAAPETVTFPEGESVEDVLARWRAFAADLHGYDEAIVVTHDILVRLAILDATGRGPRDLWVPRVLNCGYARFEVRGGRWHLLDECIDAHLTGLPVDTTAQAL